MLRRLGKGVRRHPRTVVLVLVLVTLAGAYGYVLRQWHLAQAAVKDHPAEARDRLGLCLLLWPRSTQVHLLAARAARLTGDLEGAEAHLHRCLKLEHGATQDVQLEFLLLRVQRGQVDEVRPALLDYVMVKHPQTSLILETLARAYMQNARYQAAFGVLDRWIREVPEAAEPHHWRGWILERMLDFEGARKDYERAIELDPDLADVRLRLAELWLAKANPPGALPHLERLRRDFPDRPDVLARLGQCRLLQGQTEEARRLLEAAAPRLPHDIPLLINLAKLELQEGRPAQAEQWLRRALEEDPTDTEARYNLATTLRTQGRREEAAAALEQHEKDKARLIRATHLLRDEVDRPTTNPDALCEVGTLFLDSKQERLGLYWLHQALEYDPNHRPTHQALAAYYERKGDRDKAAAHRRRLEPPSRAAASP